MSVVGGVLPLYFCFLFFFLFFNVQAHVDCTITRVGLLYMATPEVYFVFYSFIFCLNDVQDFPAAEKFDDFNFNIITAPTSINRYE